MKKRLMTLITLLLCVVLAFSTLVSCKDETENDGNSALELERNDRKSHCQHADAVYQYPIALAKSLHQSVNGKTKHIEKSPLSRDRV